jgi:HEAT repeat protein
LAGSPAPTTGAGAALVLGSLHVEDAAPVILRAMARGVVPVVHALHALAELGSRSALPAILEVLGDPDPLTRKEAIRAATALLDPSLQDGRPVDPARAALFQTDTSIEEKVELCRLFGHTGSPRATSVLLTLISAKPVRLRLAVLEALGNVKVSSPEVDKALLDALDDELPEVRRAASMAFARVGSASALGIVLDRLLVAAEQDRGALGIAVSGALSRVTDPLLAARVGAAIPTVSELARDALIEGLGRMKGPDAGRVVATLAHGPIEDRRKVAEALAGHPEAAAVLASLANDPDPGVRANAVYALGAVGKKDAEDLVASLTRDTDVAVAGNAVAAMGRLAARGADAQKTRGALCPALLDIRPYVRANALAGLSVASLRCEDDSARAVLARDSSDSARLAAADFIAHEIARAGTGANPADVRALARCVGEDVDSAVAGRCAHPLLPAKGVDDVAIYVVPDGRNVPQPLAPYTLVRADGILRIGFADRRGEIFELATPTGTLRLAVPAALAR